MDVTVNGRPRAVPAGSTVSDLVVSLGLAVKGVVVERNGEPVERARFAEIVLDSGDVVEVVRPVPGG